MYEGHACLLILFLRFTRATFVFAELLASQGAHRVAIDGTIQEARMAESQVLPSRTTRSRKITGRYIPRGLHLYNSFHDPSDGVGYDELCDSRVPQFAID